MLTAAACMLTSVTEITSTNEKFESQALSSVLGRSANVPR